MNKNKKIGKANYLAYSLMAFFLLFPAEAKNFHFRKTSQKLIIQASRWEPVKTAFAEINEDLNRNNKNKIEADWELELSKKGENLNETHLQKSGWNPLSQVRARQVNLQAMLIQSQTSATTAMSNVNYSGQMGGASSTHAQEMEWISTLTPSLRERLEEANYKNNVLEQNWEVPTWKDFAAGKIEQAKAEMQKESGGTIYVASTSDQGKTRTPEDFRTANVEIVPQKASGPYKVHGQVVFAKGLILGDRRLEIRHFVDGISTSAGRIDLQSAKYSIDVDKLEGTIGIDLLDQDNSIIANGKLRLNPNFNAKESIDIFVADSSKLAGSFFSYNQNTERLVNEKLNSFHGESAEYVISAIDHEGVTDEAGSFRLNKFSPNSWTLVRGKAKGLSETIALISAGEEKNIPLIREKLNEALINLTSEFTDQQDIEKNGSTAWGQVLLDGKPVSGVEIQVEGYDFYKPIYLEKLIPNQDLHETADEGYFVLLNLPTGFYSLLAKRAGQYVGHANVYIEQEKTSVVNVETSIKTRGVSVKSFDSFSGDPVAGKISLQSGREEMETLGILSMNIPQIKRHSIGYFYPQSEEFASTQFIYSDADDFIHIPVVRQQWLSWIISQMKINQIPDAGTIIGFVPEEDYTAYLPHEKEYETQNIVYFNSQGQIVNEGVAGGGFIFFNVPASTQAATIVLKNSEMINSQIIPVERGSTTVLKFHF